MYAICNSGIVVMELADDDLKTWLTGERIVSWEQKIHVLYQAALGLEHLHQARSLIHCNVKSNNFLVLYRD